MHISTIYKQIQTYNTIQIYKTLYLYITPYINNEYYAQQYKYLQTQINISIYRHTNKSIYINIILYFYYIILLIFSSPLLFFHPSLTILPLTKYKGLIINILAIISLWYTFLYLHTFP